MARKIFRVWGYLNWRYLVVALVSDTRPDGCFRQEQRVYKTEGCGLDEVAADPA